MFAGGLGTLAYVAIVTVIFAAEHLILRIFA